MKLGRISTTAWILAGSLLAASCSDDLTEATALRAAFIRSDVTIRDTTISATE